MVLHTHSHFNGFFANKDINELYVSMAIFAFGVSLIMLFVPIFVYQRGFSISQVLMFFVLAAFAYMLFTYPSAKLCSRFGAKHMLLASMPFLITFFLGLNYIYPGSVLYYILPFVASAHSALFNIAYHLNFMEHCDKSKTAREMTLVRIFSAIVQFGSPLIGALLITKYGFGFTFFLGSLVTSFSMIPLLLTKDMHEPLNFSGRDIWQFISGKKYTWMNVSFVGYSIESILNRLVWPIFLLIVLGTIKMVGFVVGGVGVFTLIASYLIAKISDKWDRPTLIKLGTMGHFLGWLFRIFVNNPLSAFVVDAYYNICTTLATIPWEAHFYVISRKKNYFEFIVARELVFNVTRIIILPLIVLLIWKTGSSFTAPFIVAAVFSLLYAAMK